MLVLKLIHVKRGNWAITHFHDIQNVGSSNLELSEAVSYAFANYVMYVTGKTSDKWGPGWHIQHYISRYVTSAVVCHVMRFSHFRHT